jgi:hypothetical protein
MLSRLHLLGTKKEARSSGFRKVSVLNRDRCL